MASRTGGGGRKPIPTALKLLAGNPGKRQLNEREPRPVRQAPKCPKHLTGEARAEWRRAAKQLLDVGVLTTIDRTALAMYCQAWARWLEAEEALRQYGVMVKSPSGFPMQSPYLAVANKAMEQMQRLLTEFGMTPASRTKVEAWPAQENDLLEELRLRGRRERA